MLGLGFHCWIACSSNCLQMKVEIGQDLSDNSQLHYSTLGLRGDTSKPDDHRSGQNWPMLTKSAHYRINTFFIDKFKFI